jgi:ActR/RegA family two-component response regulator
MKLLIVDDEKPLCETLGYIFQDKGFSVAFAFCEGDAIDLINVHISFILRKKSSKDMVVRSGWIQTDATRVAYSPFHSHIVV